ncbi:MAG TPA: nucleoside hydrolase [Gaiellaceae bacterium]|nr:nucleoside hydrolase [Gaiellaceae bacterium]
MNTAEPVPLIMDVDTGVDDCVALLYAVASPEVELVAATCCAGNVEAPRAAANTLAVLELAGAAGVEVARGSPAPLVAPLRTAVSHGPEGLGYAELPQARRSLSTRFAPDLLVEEARRRPGEITLVATGPLTNVALALARDRELPRLLRRLVIMGGSFDYPGNTTPTAEFNILVDPEAAKVVFDAFSGADTPPLICGLNVTERAEFRPEHLRQLAELAASTPDESLGADDPPDTRSQASNPLVRCLSDALRYSMEMHHRWGQGYLLHLHDPLALALALDGSLGETRAGTVDVELAGTLTRGMTVVDWHGLWERPANADVAVEIDAGRLLDEVVRRLAGLARRL